MLDFRPPVWSHSIETTSIELLNPENMGVAVGISKLERVANNNVKKLTSLKFVLRTKIMTPVKPQI
jgi:hypothetical protein